MTPEELNTKAISIAMATFFCDANTPADTHLYDVLRATEDGDEDISDFLDRYGDENIGIWEPFEGKDVDYIVNNVDNLRLFIIRTMTE
jgi:hypothetical protein